MRKIIITGLAMLGLTMGYSYAGYLQEFDLGLEEEITANSNIGNSLLLESNANFIVNDNYRIININGNGSYWSNWTYFWNGTGMYVMGGYHGSIDLQGYFNYYGIYDLDTLYGEVEPTSQFNPISGFINNSIYYNPDKLLIGGYGPLKRASLCFGYTEINKAICFTFDRSDWNNCGGQPQYCPGGVFDYITNSQGFTSYEFDYLTEYATNSPFTQTTPTNTQVNNFQCRTIQQLIDAYPDDYTVDLCYSSTKYLSGGQRITTPEKTIFELYPEFVNLRQDYNLYTNYCTPPATMQACQNAFTGKEDNYTLIQKIPSGVQPLRLYQYCNYQLNMDHNATTCVTSTGSLNGGTGVTINDIINEIGDRQREVTLPGTPPQEDNTNGSGSVFDKYTQQLEEHNIFDDLQELYTKITGIFRGRHGTKGIIPELITGLICLVVLFKLFKK